VNCTVSESWLKEIISALCFAHCGAPAASSNLGLAVIVTVFFFNVLPSTKVETCNRFCFPLEVSSYVNIFVMC